MIGHRNSKAGFTIIELMIATLVFSMVLIVITVGVLSFTRSYYKGVNQSVTQTAARTIIEGIAQSIQFSGDVVTTPILQSDAPLTPTVANPKSQGFCVGNKRYSYVLGKQLWDEGTPDTSKNQSSHALVMDKAGSCAGAKAQNVMGGGVAGTELLQPRMRLSKLSVTRLAGTDTYSINVRVVYGDDDLLYSPSAPNDPAGSTQPDAKCRDGRVGTQFCAQSELTTIVKKRITQ